MKKRMIALITAIILLAILVVPAIAAFSGVAGTVRSHNDIRWVFGGTVAVYADSGSGYAECGTGAIGPNGDYSIAFTCTPTDYTTVYVEFVFNPGPNGTPASQILTFGNLPASTGTYVLNVDTNTGPTAITLASFTAASQAGPINQVWMGLLLCAAAAAALGYNRFRNSPVGVR